MTPSTWNLPLPTAQRPYSDVYLPPFQMNRSLLFCVFMALNFGGLAIGGQFTEPGVASEWYLTLARAPWTPPGWVFGAAWSTIMVGFSWYMYQLWSRTPQSGRRTITLAYTTALLLNIAWNPLFFGAHLTGMAMLDLILLLAVVLWLCFRGWKHPGMTWARWALLPYPCWLMVAISLNSYPLWMGT